MKPVRHPSNNRTLGAPVGWDQSKLPVEELGITDTELEGVPCVMSFWQPDDVELANIAAGGLIGLSIVGRTMPPASVVTLYPELEGSEASTARQSPTAGMNLGDRIAHVGGRTNAQGYIEFGSWMAVDALIQHFLRDLRHEPAAVPGAVTQQWTHSISMMQQSVLLSAIRGPDGLAKYGGGAKMLLRWLRRCVLLSAMDGKVLPDPIEPNGGSFTGPSLDGPDDEDHWSDRMQEHVNDYLRQVDALPHHFQMHFMHAVEILGYKHPNPVIRVFWNRLYLRLVNDFHLWPETEEQMDSRLGDSRSGWLERADPATSA